MNRDKILPNTIEMDFKALRIGLEKAYECGTPEIKTKAKELVSMPVVTLTLKGNNKPINLNWLLNMKQSLLANVMQQAVKNNQRETMIANLQRIYAEFIQLRTMMLNVK